MKYTEEVLRKAASESFSITEVMRKIGIQYLSGGMHSWIKNRIRELHIDISHFQVLSTNSGKYHKGGSKRATPEELLVLITDGWRKTGSHRLRRALLEIGRKQECSKCLNQGTWQGAKLVLQIEHKNGNAFDNRPENLEFLCPNCHSQTATYAQAKNPNNGMVKQERPAKPKYVTPRRVNYDEVVQLWEQLRNKSEVARKFKVSENLVRRIIKNASVDQR